MRALTIQQPWASLICPPAPHRPVKRVETRGQQTRYRGDLLICAGKSTEGIESLPGDCEGKIESGWVYGYVGDFQACYCFRTTDEGRVGDAELTRTDLSTGPDFTVAMPMGMAVGVARLAACLPIDPHVGHETEDWTPPDDHLYHLIDGMALFRQTVVGDPWQEANVIQTDYTDQLPYGHYAAGRFGWVLEEIRPLPQPIPVRGMPGMFTPPDDVVARVEEQLA